MIDGVGTSGSIRLTYASIPFLKSLGRGPRLVAILVDHDVVAGTRCPSREKIIRHFDQARFTVNIFNHQNTLAGILLLQLKHLAGMNDLVRLPLCQHAHYCTIACMTETSALPPY